MGTIADRETPDGKKFKEELKKLSKLRVKIGYQQGQVEYKDEDGETADLCDIAMFNEVGTANAPSRPFMRDSCDNHEAEINAFYQEQLKLLEQGKTTAEMVMKNIGVFHKGLVQREIKEGKFEPNAPSTIKKKKSSHPLIATGLMRQSVNFVITEK